MSEIDFAVLVLVRELYLPEGSVAPSARARIQMPLPLFGCEMLSPKSSITAVRVELEASVR